MKDILLGIVEAVLRYGFFWYLLDSIQKQRGPAVAAAVLLVLFYLAFLTSPWVRETPAWDRLAF